MRDSSETDDKSQHLERSRDIIVDTGWDKPVTEPGFHSSEAASQLPAKRLEAHRSVREAARRDLADWGGFIDEQRADHDGKDTQRHGPPDFPNRGLLTDAIAASKAYDALSLGEAEAYAKDHVGVEHADFKNFDQATANDVNATLEALKRRYPDVGGLHYLGTIQERNDGMLSDYDHYVAPVHPKLVAQTASEMFGPYAGIAINRDKAGDHTSLETRLRRTSQRGWSAPGVGSVCGLITHEFGHLVYQELLSSGRLDSTVGALLDEYWQQGEDWIRENISGYAARKPRELFAETFAEYLLSPSPRKVATEIGCAIDRCLIPYT